ncbi:MAG: amidohydrolase family protein [Pseudoxanthomonas sp.]
MKVFLRNAAVCLGAGLLCLSIAAAAPPATSSSVAATTSDAPYSTDDFAKVRKYDAHVHANSKNAAFTEQARADNFELMSINVDYPDFPSLALQHEAALALAKAAPDRFHWATTFSMKGFGEPDWAARVDAGLTRDVGLGARGVKIWKNVGMIEKDAGGKLIMLDTPALSPLAERIRTLGVALIGHQGEPHNCWLPLDKMTTENDREYFRNHPEYHMYLHPDQPSYEDQIAARDRFVAAHPQLRFVGAHMGSLEYDVDRLAAFLDRYPNASVDLAARMSQVQYQSLRDREKVRGFFIRYQDRLLYGTDLTFGPEADPAEFKQEAHRFWTSDWRYLATGETQHVEFLHAEVPGLALPRAVIDKIYYSNSARAFGPAKPQAD